MDPLKQAALRELARRELARRQAANASPPSRPIVETSKQFGSGVVEGLTDIAAQAGRVANPLKMAASAIETGADWLGYGDSGVAEVADRVAGPDTFRPVVEPYIAEPQPGYEFSRKAGQFTGSSLPFGLAGATKSAGGLALAGAKEAAYGLIGAGGDSAGRSLAEKYAPGNELAEDLAGLVGSVGASTMPGLAKAGGKAAAKGVLGDTGVPSGVSPAEWVTGEDVLAAARRLQMEDAITGGMVGNRAAATMDNWMTMLPWIGKRTSEKMNELPGLAQSRMQDITRTIRAVPPDPLTGSAGLPGGASQAHSLAPNTSALIDEMATGLSKVASKGQEDMMSRVGADTPVDVAPIRAEIDDLAQRRGGDLGKQIAEREAVLSGDRTAVIDTAYEQTLQSTLQQAEAELRAAQARLNSAKAPRDIKDATTDINTATAKRDFVLEEIDGNRGLTYEKLKDWRGNTRAPTNAVPSPDTYVSGRLEDSATSAMRATAERRGVPGAEWDAEQARYARLKSREKGNEGLVPRLEKLGGTEERQAYANLTANSLNNPERFTLLRDAELELRASMSNPAKRDELSQRLNQIKGDLVEELGRKRPGQQELGSTWSLETFLTNWENLKSAEVKASLTNGDMALERNLNDMALLARGARARGRQANFSNTQVHATIQRLAQKLGGAGGGLIGAALAGTGFMAPVLTAGGLAAGAAAGKAADALLSSKRWPEILLHGAKGSGKKIVKRAGQAAAVSATNALAGGPR